MEKQQEKEVKLALPFALNNDFYTNQTDEFNILFNPKRNSLDKLYTFCDTFSDRRINIEYSDNDPKASEMRSLLAGNKNIYCRIKEGNINALVTLIEAGVPAFFDSDRPASNVSELSLLLSLGISDVYLADDLWYNIIDIYGVLQKNNVQNRLVLNRIPSVLPNAGYDIKAHIFPPEVGSIIFPYIDTVEFDCGRPFNWNHLGVYYRAWFTRKDWHGNLKEINKTLQLDIPNDSLLPDSWIKFKINCGRRCDTRTTSSCHKCEQMLSISTKLADKKIGVWHNRGQKETD